MYLLSHFLELVSDLKVKYELKNIEFETDPLVKLEKQIVHDVLGASLGGMAASTAFVEYKGRYYDCILDPLEKDRVDIALLSILSSNNYNVKVRARVSYVCADIQLAAAIDKIEALLPFLKDDSSEKRMVLRSLDALHSNVSMTEKNYTDAMKR